MGAGGRVSVLQTCCNCVQACRCHLLHGQRTAQAPCAQMPVCPRSKVPTCRMLLPSAGIGSLRLPPLPGRASAGTSLSSDKAAGRARRLLPGNVVESRVKRGWRWAHGALIPAQPPTGNRKQGPPRVDQTGRFSSSGPAARHPQPLHWPTHHMLSWSQPWQLLEPHW